MKTMPDEKLLSAALETERRLSAEEAAWLAEDPELAALRAEAVALLALPMAAPEVPASLSGEIRAAARRRRVFRPVRARRRGVFIPVAAAAALLLGFGLVWLNWGTEKLPAAATAAVQAREVDKKLLSLADWSLLDQEVYNLNFELNSRQFAVAESPVPGDIL